MVWRYPGQTGKDIGIPRVLPSGFWYPGFTILFRIVSDSCESFTLRY